MPTVLADVNLWLATVLEGHPHHRQALQWWRGIVQRNSPVAFCRLTQLGVLRLLNNEKVMGEQRMSLLDAWRLVERLLQQDPIVFADEPSGLDDHLGVLCRREGSSKNFWTDAYLASFATAAGFRLTTFDRGFKKFPDLDLEILRS